MTDTARRLVQSMAARDVRQKFLLCFIALVILAAIIVTVYFTTTKKKK